MADVVLGFGKSDHEKAATKFAGRESASDRKARTEKTSSRKRRARGIAEAGRAGEAWEAKDRRRFR